MGNETPYRPFFNIPLQNIYLRLSETYELGQSVKSCLITRKYTNSVISINYNEDNQNSYQVIRSHGSSSAYIIDYISFDSGVDVMNNFAELTMNHVFRMVYDFIQGGESFDDLIIEFASFLVKPDGSPITEAELTTIIGYFDLFSTYIQDQINAAQPIDIATFISDNSIDESLISVKDFGIIGELNIQTYGNDII